MHSIGSAANNGHCFGCAKSKGNRTRSLPRSSKSPSALSDHGYSRRAKHCAASGIASELKREVRMRCDEVAEFVSARCDGEMIPQTAAEHMGTCAHCQALLVEYIEMGSELRRTASLEIEESVSPLIWTKPQSTFSMMSNTESQAVALKSGHEFDGFLGKALEEKPIWMGLYESTRDVFFPVM